VTKLTKTQKEFLDDCKNFMDRKPTLTEWLEKEINHADDNGDWISATKYKKLLNKIESGEFSDYKSEAKQ
jgi:hypothetical protein